MKNQKDAEQKGKLELYHFSKADLKKVNPSFFGLNSYTVNDSRFKVKRAFFYTVPQALEYRFKGLAMYRARVNAGQVYNLIADRRGLKLKYGGNIEGLLNCIKKEYKGLLYEAGGLLIASLFYSVKVEKVNGGQL
jgi:hypothetical protein